MPAVHDPYLNTVKRTLTEEKIKKRKQKFDEPQKPKSFFSKNFLISDYIYLPESLQNFFLLTIFISIPYLFGLFIMAVLLGDDKFQEITTFNFDLFMLSWTVGYETIAFIVLISIVKGAISFKKK